MSWLITGLNCSVESCQRIPDRPAIRLHLLPGESGGRGRRRQAAQPGPNLEMIIMQTKQQKSNVVRLAIAQALSMTSMNVNIINTALVGYLLAPAPWLATLPLSLQFVSVMMITLPASLLMARIGRRPVFIAGVLISCISSLLLGMAIIVQSFPLFCGASMGLGVSMGISAYYRYAAADGLAEKDRAKAISYVLAGGLAAAVMGPEIARNTVDLVPGIMYAGCFFVVAIVQLVSLFALAGVKIEKPKPQQGAAGRPIGAFFRMPVYIVGIVCAAIGYALMSYLMTATPLEVVNVAKLGTSANATIIQWHVVAMFLPSFFTGNLIARFGTARVLWAGVLFYLATIILALAADGFWLYWFALVTLGLGWNFLYIGGSSLIARVAEPIERGRVQGFGDLMTTTTVAIASLTAGAVHSQYGWEMMSQVAILPVGVVVLALLWLAITQRSRGTVTP